jgi:hypothetical protein
VGDSLLPKPCCYGFVGGGPGPWKGFDYGRAPAKRSVTMRAR